MKISEIRARTLRYNYPPGFEIRDAKYSLMHRECIIVEAQGDDGNIGLGEAITIPGPPVSTSTVITQELAPRLIGQDPFDRERLWHEMYYGSYQHGRKGLLIIALSALDTAIWDLCARSLGLPLYKLLGGFRNRVPAYASGGFYTTGDDAGKLESELRGYVQAGFRAVKIKIGRKSLREDIERLRVARQAVGADVTLMVDANRSYNLREAIAIGRELDRLGVYFFEEPCNPDDLEGYRRLGEKVDVAIAAGENEYSPFGFRDLLDLAGVRVAQPDASWSGGITACLKIAAMCEARHVEVAPHTFTSIVNLAAHLHLLGAIPSGSWLEWDQNPNALRTELADFPLKLDHEGMVTIPEGPGLGLTLDPLAVAKYAIDV